MTAIELSILAPREGERCVVAARCGGDTAIEELSLSALEPLVAFRDRLAATVLGAPRPRQGELRRFGRQLHDALLGGTVRDLVAARRRRSDMLCLELLTNRPEVTALPWEMLIEPRRAWGPSPVRCLVRLVPSVGRWPRPARTLRGPLRVLLVYADPVGESPVPWPETRAVLERDFDCEASDRIRLEVVEGRRVDLVPALQSRGRIDVLHFVAHGRLRRGVGQLLLAGRGDRPSPVSVDWLSTALGGRDIRLVVLTACDSSAADPRAPFGVLGAGLVRSGVPAVVAHQLPVALPTVAPFVRSLYAGLLRSGNVDGAVAEARVRMATDLAPPDDVFEWGIPTLHRHVEAAQLFDMAV